MLRKLRAIIVGGLALCCLYLFALYLRADGGGLVKNAISLADVAQETVCPTEAPAATEAPAQSAADLAHALGVIFMVGGIQLFTVTIAAGVPVLRSVG